MRRLLGAPALPLLYSLYYTVQYFLPFRSKKKCPHLLLFIFIYLNKRSCGVIDTACIFYFFPYHRCFAYDFRFRSSPKVCLCMHSNICANSNLYSGAQDGCFDKKKKTRVENFVTLSGFFSSKNTPWAPDSRAKAFLNFASNSPRYDRFSNAKIVHAVSMTSHARKFVVR
jgi:hypothetical protein